MKTFRLVRDEDVTGVSGTGVVAEGCEFATGWVALTWLTSINSMVFYPHIANVIAIHGHDGRTRIEWEPDYVAFLTDDEADGLRHDLTRAPGRVADPSHEETMALLDERAALHAQLAAATQERDAARRQARELRAVVERIHRFCIAPTIGLDEWDEIAGMVRAALASPREEE